MSNYARYRDLHLWVGLLLLIPISVIAVTGFLWNHERALGLKAEEQHSHQHAASSGDASPSLTSAPTAWQAQSAAIESALAAATEIWGSEADLERIELKQEHGLGLVVKVKAPEDAGLAPHEIVWSVAEQQVVERKGDPRAGTDWARIVHDLHTGKFFSRRFGYLWSDSGALAIVFLGATGVVLYLLPVLKKRGKRAKPAAAGAVASAASPLETIRSTAAPVN